MFFRVALPLVVLAACAPVRTADDFAHGLDSGDFRSYATNSPEAALIVRAANEGTFEQLDKDAGLDKRAAEGLVARRPFTSVEEVDRVPYVGERAMDQLFTFATKTYGVSDVEPETGARVHGIEEGSPLAAGILVLANTAGWGELDNAIGLDSRAALSIVELRPLTSLAALDAVPYVGAAAFRALAEHADEVQVPTACEPGTIRNNQGAMYTDLGDAVYYAAPGAHLEVCPGTYELTNLEVVRSLNISGVGDVTIRIEDSLDVGATYNSADGVFGLSGVRLEAENLYFYMDSALQDIEFRIEHSTTISNTGVDFVDIDFRGGQISLHRDAEMNAVDSFFRATGTYAIDVSSGNLDMQRGGVIQSAEHGVYVERLSEARFENVDFGIGPDENQLSDISLSHVGLLTWLHEDTDLFCTGYGCEEL